MAHYRIAQDGNTFRLIKHCGTRAVVMPIKARLVYRARCESVDDIVRLEDYVRVDWAAGAVE